jgi:hypothetical protein
VLFLLNIVIFNLKTAIFNLKTAFFNPKTAISKLKKPNNYPDLHHLQGVMKFAKLILPLLNL